MQDKRDELYKNLIQSGKVSEGQIGTVDQFKSAIKDEVTARKFHENLIGAGFSAEEIGDVDGFYGSISSDFTKSANNATQTELATTTATPKKGVEIFGGIPYSEYKEMPGKDRLKAYSEWQQGKDKELRGANNNQVESLYADVNKEMEHLSSSEKIEAPAGAGFIPAGAYGAAQRYGNTQNKEKQDRYTMLESAKGLLENSQQMIAEAGKKGDTNFFAGAGRGFKDKAFNLDTWAMGVTDLYKNKFIQDAAQKADKGEGLTQEEQRLLDAATVNMVTQAMFSSDLGRGYKAGCVTAESLPFMLEMIANPAATAGKGIGNAILRYGVKKFGVKTAEKVTGAVTKKLLGNVAKASTRVAGDVIAASAMTATSGLARTAAAAISRGTGQTKYGIDENGNAEYAGMDGGVGMGEAAYKAFAGNTIENFSEMFGNYFGALGGVIGKTKPMRALQATKVGEAFSKINSSDWAKEMARFSNRANYNGTFGEYGEEVVGTILNSIFTGDQPLSELTDIDQQIDTFLGVSLMGGFMSTAKALGYRTPKYEAEKNLGKSEKEISKYYGEGWDEVRSSLENSNVEDRKDYLNSVFSSDMNMNEKRAMFEYVSRLTTRDAIKAGNEKLAEEGIDLNDGITQNKASVYNGYNEAAKKALNFLSVEAIDEVDQLIESGSDINVGQLIGEKGLPDDQSEALMDYAVAKQDFNDYINGVQSRISEEKASARHQVELVSNPDMGVTIRVKSSLSENPVHVVGGRLVFDDRGFVDESKSDEIVYYMDGNGERKMASPAMFESLIDSTPTEDLASRAELEAEESIINQEDSELSPPEIGQSVYTPEGTQGEITRFTAEGDPIVLSQDGERPYKKEQLSVSGTQEEESGSFVNIKNGIENEGFVEENTGIIKNDNKKEDISREVDSDPLVAPENGIQEVSPSVIPVDGKGNVLYHKMPVEDTIDALNGEDLDLEELGAFISANKEAAGKLLSNLQGKAPKMGTHIPKYKADKSAWRESVTDAQAQVDYWNSVEEEFAATRSQPGDATADAISSMGDPMTGSELAATMLGTGRLPLLYDSYKKELGFSNGDARGMFGMFATKANGGMSIEEAGEQLMLSDAEGGTNFFDQSDPNAGRNAILDVLSGARTKGDLFGYIRNNREAMAERERQAELEAYEQTIVRLAEDCHLSPDEFIAFEESIGRMIEDRLKNVSDEKLKGIFAELYLDENYGRSRESDKMGTGVPEGEERAGSNEGGSGLLGKERNNDTGTGERGAERPERDDEIREPGDSVLSEADAVEGRAIEGASVIHAENEVDTNPTEAQKNAGNYKKGHIRIADYDITIENPKGSERKGIDANGNLWSITMNNTYGYFRGTKGKDGDHIDLFLGDNLDPENVYVVDQVSPDGSFDEHKVLFGFDSKESAQEAYLSNYEEGWKGLGEITGVPRGVFDEWLGNNSKKQKPFSEYRSIQIAVSDEFVPLEKLTKDDIINFSGDEVQKRMAIGYLDGNKNSINTIAYEYLKQKINELNRSVLLQSNSERADSSDGINEEVVRDVSRRNGRSGERRKREDRGSVQGRILFDNEGHGGVRAGSQSDVDGDGSDAGTQSDQPIQGSSFADVDTNTGNTMPDGRNGDSGSRNSIVGEREEADKDATGNVGKKRDRISSLNQEKDDALNDLKAALKELRDAGKESLSLSVVGLNARQIEVTMKVVSAGSRYGYALVKEGVVTLGNWVDRMREALSPSFKSMRFSEEEIDEFIKDMWNAEIPGDSGVFKSVKQWAEELGIPKTKGLVHSTLEEKRERQIAAESVSAKIGDLDNIRASLPFLLEEQQDDVLKAEDRFFSDTHKTRDLAYGKGIMFTNGTGTGKTYTGLGVIKRFIKRGRNNVLIIVPSQNKVSDWIKDGVNLGIEISALENIKSAGKDVVITTYANFGVNRALYGREFDLIVYDESHRLMENKDGDASSRTAQHYLVSNRNADDALRRLQKNHKLWQREEKIALELKAAKVTDDMMDEMARGLYDKQDHLKEELSRIREQQREALMELEVLAKKASDKTKVLFLSATPFKDHFNLRYAEQYLFSYPEKSKEFYNDTNPEEQFYLENFGSAYKMRYNRLEKSGENADLVSRQEIEFSQKLTDVGVMSGRMINSEMDYSRDFPTVTGFNSEVFNNALNDVFNFKEDAEFKTLIEAFSEVFHDYNYSTKLFEVLKTSASVERIRRHLDAGRKIVVFHRRRQGDVVPPFKLALDNASNRVSSIDEKSEGGKEKKAQMILEIDKFKAKYGQLLDYEQTLNYLPVADQLQDVFGGRAVVFNGSVSKSGKSNAVDDFNRDDSGVDIIVIQEDSGKEGISLHDQTGEHQRVLMNMALPISSITALQIEGRTYRIGNATNAIFEYPLLGLDLEIYHFGSKLNKKLSTTENLAMGNLARDLLSSFANGVLEQRGDIDIQSQGTGGKSYDKRVDSGTSSLFEKAVSAYYNVVKRSSKTKSMEGIDYFPTPEPLGLKMVEWGSGREDESFLEPSAGHGAIARWIPTTNKLTAIEPSGSLFSKLNVSAGGGVKNIIQERFEDYHVINKHDVIVMNPPFGSNSKTAADHIEKAFSHLRNGGRIVAVIPDGSSMNKRLDKFLYGENDKGKLLHPDAVIRGEILLPSATFERVGTSAVGKVVIIDRVIGGNNGSHETKQVDLRGVSDVISLFEAIRDLDMPERVLVEKETSVNSDTSEEDRSVRPDHKLPKSNGTNSLLGDVEAVSHTKTGEELFKVSIGRKLSRNDFVLTARVASEHKGYWSKFAEGFLFKNREEADVFVSEVNSKDVSIQQSSVDSNRPLPGESLSDFVNRINNIRIEKGKNDMVDECMLVCNDIKEQIGSEISVSVCKDEMDVYVKMRDNNEFEGVILKVRDAFERSKSANRKFCGFLSSVSGNVYICAEEHLNSPVHPRMSIMHESTHKVIGDNYSKEDLVSWYDELGRDEISKYVPKHYFEGELTDNKKSTLANEYFAHIVGLISRSEQGLNHFLGGNLSFIDKFGLPKTALNVINELSDLIRNGYESRKFERDNGEGLGPDNQHDGRGGVSETEEYGGLEEPGSREQGLRSGDAYELSRDRRERYDGDLTDNDFSEDGTPSDDLLFLDSAGEDILRHVREDERSITQVIDAIRNIDAIKSNDLSKRTLGTKVAEGLFDDSIKLKMLQNDIEAKRGSTLEGYMNPYQFVTSIPKRNEYMTEQFNEKFMRPIYQEMRRLKDADSKEKEIYSYLYAKSGLERNEKMRTKAMLEYISEIKDDVFRNDLLAYADGLTISEMVFSDENVEKKRLSLLSRDYSGLTELREILFDDHSNKNEKNIQAWVDGFENRHEVGDLWIAINKATKETLENEFRNGKIDKATKIKISAMYDYYLPLRDWEGEKAGDVWEYTGGDRNEGMGQVVKKAFGRKSLAGNPIVNIGLMGQQSIHSGNRNTLKQMFLSMARNNPNESYSVSPLWIMNTGTEESPNWVETAPEWDDDPYVFADNVERFDKEMEDLRKAFRAKNKYTRESLGLPITKMEANEHQVIVSEAGKKYIVYVNSDPAISRAINGIAGKGYGVQDGKALKNDFVQGLIRTNGVIMRTMGQSFTTWNPMFILANGQRDIMNALLVASVKEGKEYAGEVAKNMLSPSVHGAIMRAVLGSPDLNNPVDRLFKEYESNGGETGFSELFKDVDFERQIKKELNKKKVDPMIIMNLYLGNVEKLNRWAENVSRFSTYKASRDSGRDIYRSVYDAKEITVNFNRRGTGACVGNFLRLAYIFSGAGLQAMYQMGRLSLSPKTRKKAAVLMTSVAIAGYLIPLMNNMLLGGDGDDIEDGYDYKPEYERKSNIMVRVGKGKFVKLSIPQELRPFWNIGETLYQLTKGNINTWEAGVSIGEGFAGLMPFDPFGSSGLAPTVLQPIDQARNNENFFGGKIYKDETRHNKHLPQWHRSFKNTSPIFLALSKWLNDKTGGDEATQGRIDVNPGVMEHLVEGYFGGAVKFLNNIAKTSKGVIKAAGGDSSFLETRNIPFISTFYTGSDNPISKEVDRMYWDYVDLSEKVETREREYKELMKSHPDKAIYYQEKIKELKDSDDYKRKYIIDGYHRRISDMTELVNRDILDSESKSAVLNQIKEIKKEMLNELKKISDHE